MKKKYFSLALIAIFFNITSCSNIESESESTYSQLKSFNDSFEYETVSSSSNEIIAKKKKSWWNYVGEVTAIATADAGGAATGVAGAQAVAGLVGAATAGTGYAVVSGTAAVIGAAGGSYGAYTAFYPQGRQSNRASIPKGKFTTNEIIGSSVVYTYPSKFKHISKFGELHNSDLEQNYTGQNFSNQNELNWIKKNYTVPDNIKIENMYNSTNFQNYKNTVKDIAIEYAINKYDCTFFLKSLKDKELISSTTSNYLELFFKAQIKSKSFEDTKKINDYYVNTVVNSKLSDKDKESLLSAFTVYIQSYYYWINFETI